MEHVKDWKCAKGGRISAPKINPSWSWVLWHMTSCGNGTADGRKGRTMRWKILLDSLGRPSGLQGSWQQRPFPSWVRVTSRGRREEDVKETWPASLRGGATVKVQWPPATGMALSWQTTRTRDQSPPTHPPDHHHCKETYTQGKERPSTTHQPGQQDWFLNF